MRILGLDVGTRRIGVAMSDEMGWTAQGLKVIHCNGSELEEIGKVIEEYEVSKVVIGIPLKLNGEASLQTGKVYLFKEELEKVVKIPIIEWDERLTTAEAERMLIASDVSRGKRKKVIDKIAASLILQNYLDYLGFQNKN